MKKKLLIYLLGVIFFVLPIVLIFKNIFINRILAGGDAPFFYKEGLAELVSEPIAWSARETNFGGPNTLLWISPLTFVYGILGSNLGLGNELAIRITFYLPALLLGVLGIYFLSKYQKFSTVVAFFGALFYIVNSYFILLVDGGQVGVMVAYGIFPFSLLFLKKLLNQPGVNNFYFALGCLFINGVADPRIALISILTILVWTIFAALVSKEYFKLRNILLFAPLSILWLLVNSYWIYPLAKMSAASALGSSVEFNFISLLSAIFIFQPHFPANDFGKINPPQFYYAILPALVFANLFWDDSKKTFKVILLAILAFTFFAKGSTAPLGDWYNYFVSKIPFGSALRDSSKFFIPLILFSGFLIGNSIEQIGSKIKSTSFRILFFAFSVVSIVFLVYPSMLGKMNFVLSDKTKNEDTSKIYSKIKEDDGFFRAAWFSEVSTTAFESRKNPSIDGKDLVNLIPFRSENASNDVFNFVNNPDFLDWFRILGIKYLFLNGNPRSLSMNSDEIEKWEETKKIIDIYSKNSDFGIKKVDWGTGFPAYEIEGAYPHWFVADKLIAIVGSPLENPNTKFYPNLYFEDGKLNPRLLEGKSPDSVKILFNNKDRLDLSMSFLSSFFTSTLNTSSNQWAKYGPDEYLKAKYELLIRDLKYKDLDYGQGLSFSTVAGEKLDIPLTATSSGEFVLAVRGMSTKSSDSLKLLFGDKNLEFKPKVGNFGWYTLNVSLEKGVHCVTFENKGGLQVVNVVALIPKNEFTNAQNLSDVFVKHFGKINESQASVNIFNEAEITTEGTSKYKFTSGKKGYWLVFTDSYNKLWNLRRGQEIGNSVPVYGIVNGFYFEPNWNDLHVEYKGQEFVRWGLYWSVCILLLLFVIYFWIKSRTDGKN